MGYSNYNDPTAGDTTDDQTIDFRGIASPQELAFEVDTGLPQASHPSRVPHTGEPWDTQPSDSTQKRTIAAALTGLARSDQSDIVKMQRDLVEGGYLKLKRGESEDDAANGDPDTRTLKAYLGLLRDSSRTKTPVNALLRQRIDQGAGQTSSGGAAAVREPTTAFRPGVVEPGLHRTTALTSPTEIQFTTRNIARAVLGREPTEPEIQRAVSSIQGQERAVGQAEFNAAEKERTELFRARVAEQGAGATAEQQKQEQQIRQGEQRAGIASPGNLVSVGGVQVNGDIQGDVQGILGQFGVTATSGYRSPDRNKSVGGAENSDHLSGNAVDFGGTPEQIAALYNWATSQAAANGWYVEPMDQAKNHVHISFRRGAKGASLPSAPTITPAGGGGTVQVGPDVQLPSSLTEVTKTPSPDAEVYKELTGVGSPTRLEYGAHLAATSVFDSLIRAMRGTGFETGGVTEAGGANV